MDRLLVISNRLPITLSRDITENSENLWNIKKSSGGLASALSGLKKEMTFTWIGWPGIEIPLSEQLEFKNQLLNDHSCLPVFLTDEIAELHYNGFSNSILWPLFHYETTDLNFNEKAWEGYRTANETFANAITEIVQNGDTIWIHDYHLMLLPQMMREKLNPTWDVKIGFFLHTPFPSSEITRSLPVRKQVLQGLLESDLIGFHTYDYARHFISSCVRILGLNTMPNGIEHNGRFVAVGAFPIGIDPEQFINGLDLDSIKVRMQHLRNVYRNKRIIVGVDRLDYIKGVPQKLHAFEAFLSRYPEYVDSVVLIQVAVPSRTDVKEYLDLKREVNELVGQINGQYGTIESMPIHLINKSVTFEDLVALYAISDACLITSTRDGMNLVAYEYIACQRDNGGVLILSEFAGCAQSLNGALLINPWNTYEVADTIKEALNLPLTERIVKQSKLLKYVNKYTAAYWGTSFIHEINRIFEQTKQRMNLPRINTRAIYKLFSDKLGAKRVIFLDYDGTLTRTHKLINLARPSPIVLECLTKLSSCLHTLVYVLSGRRRSYLDQLLDSTGVGIVAEHGCFYKHPSSIRSDINNDILVNTTEKIDCGWIRLASNVDHDCKNVIRELFSHYTERTPGSYIEEKEINLMWHYRDTDPMFSSWQAAELQMNLEKTLAHAPLSIELGEKTLEVRPSNVAKSIAAKSILRDIQTFIAGDTQPIGFILNIGNGISDEAVFSHLNENYERATTCTVGKKESKAKCYIEGVAQVEELLHQLCSESWEKSP